MKIDYTGIRASLPKIDEVASAQQASQVRGDVAGDAFRLVLDREAQEKPIRVGGPSESEKVRNEPRKEREKKKRRNRGSGPEGGIDIYC
jgi:hypothetical protein